MGTPQSRKYEEYAYVLDFTSRGRSKTVRGRDGIIVTALGEERLTLLEILGLDESEFDIGEKIYIGKEGRTKVQSVLGKMDPHKISESIKNEIPTIIESIVAKNEKKFVDYINNAQPLTPRTHALELINICPNTMSELRSFTFGWKKLILTETLEKILKIIKDNS